MNTIGLITHGQNLVDRNAHKELLDWASTQEEFVAHAVAEHALKAKSWQCLSSILSAPSVALEWSSAILRKQVMDNNIQAVQYLAQVGNPFKTATQAQRATESAAQYCAKTNNLEMLKILLDGAESSTNPCYPSTDNLEYLLFHATEYNNTEMFTYIVQRYANINILEELDLYSLLSEAVAARNHDIVDTLLSNFSDLIFTASDLASRYNNIECLKRLKDLMDPKDFTSQIVDYCATKGDFESLSFFGIDEKDVVWKPHHVSTIVQSANLDLFKRVVPNKCAYTLTPSNYTTVFECNDEEKILKFLDMMIPLVDPSLDDSYALTQAVHAKKWKVVEMLLPLTDPNTLCSYTYENFGQCPLPNVVEDFCNTVGHHVKQDFFTTAASCNNLALVQYLLPNVNPKFNQSAALKLACSNEHTQIAQLLLPYSDVISQNFEIFETIARADNRKFSEEVLIKAVAEIPENKKSEFVKWCHTLDEEIKEQIQHTLNTLENQSLHNAIQPTQRYLKKRKM